MATGSDQLIGYSLVVAASIIFTYYTLWVVILPFVDDDHVMQSYFLPRIYALLLPIAAGVVVLIGIGLFTASVMMKDTKKYQRTKSN